MRPMPKPRPTPTGLFQSTHPVRGATATCRHTPEMHAISIHAPREGCDPPARTTVPVFHVFQSTHPVRGATHVHSVGVATCEIFQSTHPVRGATTFCHSLSPCGYISIHAPREGCDVSPMAYSTASERFQSTHPVRGATPFDGTTIV